MKPWLLLDKVVTNDGTELTLMRHDQEFVIFADEQHLMSSRMHGSEEALATFGCQRARLLEAPCVLVGGLGMGFTLRAALDILPPDATVIVSELLPKVVDWNRGPLGPLAAHPLNDPRVQLEVDDVAAVLRRSRGRFDAVLLDVDNGPDAFTAVDNAALYHDRGVAVLREALAVDGLLAVWSAWEDPRFARRLRRAAFTVDVERVRARLKQGGPRHVVYLAYETPDGKPPARSRRRARPRLSPPPAAPR